MGLQRVGHYWVTEQQQKLGLVKKMDNWKMLHELFSVLCFDMI